MGLCLPPRTAACKRKLLLVKYIYKKNNDYKNVIKKESYNPLRMRNEWNKADGVCGNETVNMMVLVLHIKV
jgi:hypothetical protein